MMKIVRKDYMWQSSRKDDEEDFDEFEKYGLSKEITGKKLVFDSINEQLKLYIFIYIEVEDIFFFPSFLCLILSYFYIILYSMCIYGVFD